MNGPTPQGGVLQNVTATGGFAYGVIGADLHVLGGEVPLYVLENYLPAAPVDPYWLRELPSRMLSARNAVVLFSGREREREELREWCHAGTRLAARWMHAPGGQGKTRLAARLAEELLVAGWKVVTATQGPGAVLPPPGSQDMRLDGAAGLLLIIDYADRWPLTHLAWLLGNALLHQTSVLTRVLLLARTGYAWPALRERLGNYRAGVSQQFLAPLADEPGPRQRAFLAARDSFATQYGIDDASAIAPPASLDGPEWGLILTVHMAALVAVDAYVQGKPPPGGPASLTAYLLDRERGHWARLYENRTQPENQPGLEFQTPPSMMSQAVFTAALTGPVNYQAGKTILHGLDLELPSERVLTDHTVCYPPADPRLATVLEPLYPDRLAEDFLGATIPGHTTDQPAYAWASLIATTILDGDTVRDLPAFAPRAINFLAAAIERWSHVGETFLYPLLRLKPQLAVDAGSPALTALADVRGIPIDVLETIERLFPSGRHVDLDPGIAVVARRLTDHRLAAINDLSERAQLYLGLAKRLSNAGEDRESIQITEEAVALYRRLTASQPASFEVYLAKSLSNLGWLRLKVGLGDAFAATEEAVTRLQRLQEQNPGSVAPELAGALNNLGQIQSSLGLHAEALTSTREAVEIHRRLAAANPTESRSDLAKSLGNLGRCMSDLGQREEALAVTEEAAKLFRPLAASQPAAFEPDLAVTLNRLGNRLRQLGRWDEALRTTEEAVRIGRRLAAANPAAFEPDLAMSLANLGSDMSYLGHHEDALAATGEAVDLYRRLAADNPAAVEPALAMSLDNLGLDLSRAGRPEEALAATEEAIEIRRRLVAVNPGGFEPKLALSLDHLGSRLWALGRQDEALIASSEAVEIYRRLAEANPAVFEPQLAASLDDLGSDLSSVGRWEEALAMTRESVEIYRRLAPFNPNVIEPELVTSLTNLGGRNASLDKQEEALAAITEAVEISRRLAQRQPAAFQPYLAQALGNFSHAMSDLGRHIEALQAAEEAVELCRRLATDNSGAFEPTLATQLDNLGRCMSDLDRRDEALRATWEAVTIYRRLAAEHPAAFEPRLAASLDNLGKCMSDVGQREEALAPTQEAVERFRRLAADSAAMYEPNLAFALCGFGRIRAVARLELPQAVASIQEAIAIHRRLAQRSPLPLAEAIQEATDTLANVLEELGEVEQAAAIRLDSSDDGP